MNSLCSMVDLPICSSLQISQGSIARMICSLLSRAPCLTMQVFWMMYTFLSSQLLWIVSSTPNIVKVNLTQLSNRFQICLSKTSIGFLSCTICLQTGTLLIIPDLLIFVHIIIQLFSAYIYTKKKLDKDDFAVHRKKKKTNVESNTTSRH